jgi:two-component system, NtrC family, sensor kinase
LIQLDVIAGPNKGASFRPEEASFIVGRGATNRIILLDSKVSARHSQIESRGERYILRDLSSTNGTFVNGKSVTQAALKPGDRVRMGQTILKVVSIYLGSVSQANVRIRDERETRPAPVKARVRKQDPPPVIEKPGSDTSMPTLVEAYRNLLAMYKVSSIIRSNAELDKLLSEVLEQIFHSFKAERGLVMLLDDETGELVPHAFRSRSGDPDEAEMTISRTIVKQVVDKQESILTSDATLDERFSAGESVVQQGIRSAMCAPVSTNNRVLGIIYIDCRAEANTFKKADLELLTAIGNEAGIAVENGMLRDANIKSERLAAMGQTVAGLSHYIKNVLSCMQAGSEMVDRALRNENIDSMRKGWGIVQRNERKISELVMDMLNYSTAREPVRVVSDLNNIICDLTDTVQPQADALGVKIDLQLSDDLRTVEVDATGIERCLLNLLTNAIDAVTGCEAPCVTVRTEEQDGAAVIQVIDNGPGIPEETLPRIFDVFMSTKGNQGTGLGLAVVKKIVHEHAGEIAADNTPDGGAQFTIKLPFDPSDMSQAGE